MSTKELARNVQIFKKRLGGQTLQSLADEYGLSKERIRQIVLKLFRVMRHPHYQKEFPHPFTKERAPHAWKEYGGGHWSFDRDLLKEEELPEDVAYWLKLVDVYYERNK